MAVIEESAICDRRKMVNHITVSSSLQYGDCSNGITQPPQRSDCDDSYKGPTAGCMHGETMSLSEVIRSCI
jgi:hypothetical protein